MIDGTCPLVGAAQTAASRTADRGHQLVLISQPGHAATEPIASQAPGDVTVVETPAKTAALRVSDTRPVSYLMQPGVALETAAPIVTALRSRYPAVKAAVPADVCYAPSDRAGPIYSVALGSDLMLVLGDPQSADTKQICGQARDSGTRVQIIADVADLRPAMLTGVHTIGLAESTSAQAGLAPRVLSALSGLAPAEHSQAAAQHREDSERAGLGHGHNLLVPECWRGRADVRSAGRHSPDGPR